MACGRLFEGVAAEEGFKQLSPDIMNMLGKSPHEYFYAHMELIGKTSEKTGKKAGK